MKRKNTTAGWAGIHHDQASGPVLQEIHALTRATDGARVVVGGDQNDRVCWGTRRRRLLRPSGQRPAMEANRMTGPFCQRLFVTLLAASWALPLYAYDPLNRAEYLAKIKEAKAYYEDKCEKVAGIRIHKTVPAVEGLLLLKIRPERRSRELADPMWSGAAFGTEHTGDSYITSFLGYEKRPGRSTERGHISIGKPSVGIPGDRWDYFPGYRWVEVIDEKDGQRYRYSARYDEPWRTDSRYSTSYIRFNLDKIPSPSKASPRYAVTFEDHVIAEERALWVASSTVKVLDLQTHDVLAEMAIYAISYIHAPGHSMPWLNHSVCPIPEGRDGTRTRHFVDQVLIPKREK